jgi:DNA-binding beta-propeller fold protein YncE
MSVRHFRVALAAALLTPSASPAAAQDRPWRLAVVSESGDIVTWLAHRGDSLVVERVAPVGIMPADVDGPHNVAMAADARSYYVTLAHGQPGGTLWRLDAATDEVLGRAPLELFPTTIALTPDGELAFVANSDFHGDHSRVNVVSVVHTPTMTKVTDLALCRMPHGVRAARSGASVWVSCMHSDELIELDVAGLEEKRRVAVGSAGCEPTFVALSPDDATVFVPCNRRDVLQVWDAATLTLQKELPTGKGPYNAEPSPDGRWLLVTNKKDRSVSLFDLRTLAEVARLPTTKPIVHGIAWSPDSRWAYVSQESIGADPGAVDAIDITTRRTVATVAVPAQPAGIALRRLPTPP